MGAGHVLQLPPPSSRASRGLNSSSHQPPYTRREFSMATTVSHRLSTTQAHAIADLTGYEDADTLRWQQAGVTAQQRTGEQGRDARTDTDRLAHSLDLAQRGGVTLAEDLDDLRAEVTSGTAHYTVDLAQLGHPCLDFQQCKAPCTHLLAAEIHTGALGLFTASAPLIPPDTTPLVPNTSVQEGPEQEPGPSCTAGGARSDRVWAGACASHAHRASTPWPGPSPDGERRPLAHQRSAGLNEREAPDRQHGAHVRATCSNRTGSGELGGMG